MRVLTAAYSSLSAVDSDTTCCFRHVVVDGWAISIVCQSMCNRGFGNASSETSRDPGTFPREGCLKLLNLPRPPKCLTFFFKSAVCVCVVV